MHLSEHKTLLIIHLSLTFYLFLRFLLLASTLNIHEIFQGLFSEKVRWEVWLIGLGFFPLLFGVICMIVGSIALYDLYKNPSKELLKKIDWEIEKGRISKVAQKFSEKFKITAPKILLSNSDKVTIFSLPFDSRNDAIVISRKIVDNLDENELEALIAHELYHVKIDMERTLRNFYQKGEFLLFPLLASFNLYVSSLAFSKINELILEHHFQVSNIFFYGLDLQVLATGYLLILLVFMISDTLYYYKQEFMEYYADLFASILTKKPKALISCIKQLILFKIGESVISPKKEPFLIRLGRVFDDFLHKPVLGDENPKSWKELFIKTYDRHPSISSRVKFLRLLDKAINEKISIRVKNLKSFSVPRIVFPNFFLLCCPVENRCWKMGEDKIKQFYSYMESNSTSFNLVKCAEALRMDEFDVATLFIFFLERGIAEVVEPSFKQIG
jgi:Zn-dependent protease with chaperone function